MRFKILYAERFDGDYIDTEMPDDMVWAKRVLSDPTNDYISLESEDGQQFYFWGKGFCEKAGVEYEEEDDDYASAGRGDYGPGCPWNAPGMSVSDFI